MTPHFSRRQWLQCTGAGALASSLPGLAWAQASPRPLRLIVAFAPGGPVDFVARTLADTLSRELGRTVLVDNKPGANGALGAMETLKGEPDGSTVWITSVGAAAINPALYDKLPYDMQRDFTPVSLVVNNVEVLVTSAQNPATDAVDFVQRARASQAPVPMASSGIGSIPHLALLQLQDATKLDLLHVPFNGMAPALTNLLGGQVAGVEREGLLQVGGRRSAQAQRVLQPGQLPDHLRVQGGAQRLGAGQQVQVFLVRLLCAAQLRERRQAGSASYFSRLPAWVKSARNRGKVMRAIAKIERGMAVAPR